jgi:hypothetical protein
METFDTNTERKKFRAYFLEGIMLFIAVTLGFLAENLRENISNKEKEREYITSLINNLKQDTVFLNSVIRENKTKIAALDSLIFLSSKKITDSEVKRQLYKYSGYISYYSAFISNDATMMQLKNSGGLQFIKHNHIADSIAFYDQVVRSIYAAEIPYAKAIDGAKSAVEELLLFRVLKDTSYFKNGLFTEKDLPLLTTDPQKVEIFFNKVMASQGWTENYLNHLQARRPYTQRLIEMLKKEYDYD